MLTNSPYREGEESRCAYEVTQIELTCTGWPPGTVRYRLRPLMLAYAIWASSFDQHLSTTYVQVYPYNPSINRSSSFWGDVTSFNATCDLLLGQQHLKPVHNQHAEEYKRQHHRT